MTVQPTRDQLRALADAATEGPWRVDGSLFGRGRAVPDIGQTWGLRWRQDIEFICAARTAVPQLLNQLDAAEATLRRQDRYIEELESADAVGLKARAQQSEQRIRDLTQEVRDERAACLDQMEQVRVRDARIKAVEDVIDTWMTYCQTEQTARALSDIRRALEG